MVTVYGVAYAFGALDVSRLNLGSVLAISLGSQYSWELLA